jgi:hypothetical protein
MEKLIELPYRRDRYISRKAEFKKSKDFRRDNKKYATSCRKKPMNHFFIYLFRVYTGLRFRERNQLLGF